MSNTGLPTNDPTPSRFDVRRFALIVIVAGLIIAAYGAAIVASNLPVNASQASAGGNWVQDMNNAMGAMMENSARAYRRSHAMRFIWSGLVVAAVGAAAFVSVKK